MHSDVDICEAHNQCNQSIHAECLAELPVFQSTQIFSKPNGNGEDRRDPSRKEGREDFEGRTQHVAPRDCGGSAEAAALLWGGAGVSQRTDPKEIELILMLDATKRCNHRDVWRPLESIPPSDIFMVKA